MERTQRGEKRAAFAPDEPQSERRDRRIAHLFDDRRGIRHALRRRIEDQSGNRDDRDRDKPLQQRREAGEHEPAFQCALVGDHVGGDHRLAVPRSGGMEDAVSEAQSRQASMPPTPLVRMARMVLVSIR